MGMSPGQGPKKGRSSALADINVTPLVDVMLVLLVIFMVTAPMLSTSKEKVALPPVETSESLDLKDDDVILTVDEFKKIRFSGCSACKEMEISTLADTLKPNQKVQQAKQIYLYADQRLQYKTVLLIMAELRKAGVLHVGLVTNPGGAPLPPSRAR